MAVEQDDTIDAGGADGEVSGEGETLPASGPAFVETATADPGTDNTMAATPGAAAASSALGRGSAVDRYTLRRKLGEGGMGVVWEADDPDLERTVAIKLLRASAGGSEGAARLLREAQAMARLSHPNLVSVFDVGEVGDDVFVAMELIEGETLRRWIDGDRDWREVVAMFVRAGRGLAAAHAGGVVHRDFKPANVIVGSDGHPRVLDFGLARAVKPSNESARPKRVKPGSIDEPMTLDGAVMGTPMYMSPEQMRGDVSDERSDQYSFCVSLWEGLYGAPPIAPTSMDELSRRVALGDFDEPAKSDVPTRVHAILERGLSLDPADRFESIEALLAALEDDPGARRKRWLLGGGAVLAAGAIAALLLTRGEAPPSCDPDTSAFDDVWNERSEARTRALTESLPPPAARVTDALIGAFSRARTEWFDARRAACVDTHVAKTHDEATLRRRNQCLDTTLRRLRQAAQASETITSIDSLVALTARVSRESSADCLDVAPGSEPVAESAEIAALEARYHRALEERKTGRFAEAAAQFEAVATDAKAIGADDVVGSANLGLAVSRRATGDVQGALQAIDAAIEVASRLKSDTMLAQGLMEKMAILVESRQFQKADGMRAGIDAVFARIEGSRAFFHHSVRMAEMLFTMGKFDEARALAERGVALGRRLVASAPENADHQTDLADALMNLAKASIGRADWDGAVAHLTEGMGIEEAWFGKSHTRIANWLSLLGLAETGRGRFDDAIAHYERALTIHKTVGTGKAALGPLLGALALTLIEAERWERAREVVGRVLALHAETGGNKTPNYAEALIQRANLETRTGNHAAAAATFGEARAILVASLGRDHPMLAMANMDAGDLAQRSGRCREGLADLDEAVRIMRMATGDSSLLTGLALARRGACRVDAKQAGATEDLEKAVSLLEAFSGDAGPMAHAEFELARSLWASDRDRAETLLSSAEKRVATDPRSRYLRERIAAFRAASL